MVGGETFLQRPLAGRGVYVLDDHEVVRLGLRRLLGSDGLSVAGESGSAREAARRIPAVRPDLAILDVDLADGSGTEVCRALAAAGSATRCVLMTGDAEKAVLIEPSWPARGGACPNRTTAANSSGSSAAPWPGTPRSAAGSGPRSWPRSPRRRSRHAWRRDF
jgi:CheY-like chemotaxis protein